MCKKLMVLLAMVMTSAVAFGEPVLETRTLTDFNIEGEWKTDQWNKAQGRVAVRPEFPAALLTADATNGSSLGIKINFAGGAPDVFEFFSVLPGTPQEQIPFKVTQVSIWLKGSGSGHYVELHFDDALGQDQKVGVESMNFSDWRKLTAAIPATWQQPLKFRSLTFHNWHMPQPADITVYATRLEVTVDTAQPLAGGVTTAPGTTDDNW